MDKTGPPDSVFLTSCVQPPQNFNKHQKQNQVGNWLHLLSFYREVETEIELFTKLQDLEGQERNLCPSEIHSPHLTKSNRIFTLCAQNKQ